MLFCDVTTSRSRDSSARVLPHNLLEQLILQLDLSQICLSVKYPAVNALRSDAE